MLVVFDDFRKTVDIKDMPKSEIPEINAVVSLHEEEYKVVAKSEEQKDVTLFVRRAGRYSK